MLHRVLSDFIESPMYPKERRIAVGPLILAGLSAIRKQSVSSVTQPAGGDSSAVPSLPARLLGLASLVRRDLIFRPPLNRLFPRIQLHLFLDAIGTPAFAHHLITTADSVRKTRRQGRSDLESMNQVLRSRFLLMDSPYSISHPKCHRRPQSQLT